ncbi:unnamed protein product [Merluccius merluccius]
MMTRFPRHDDTTVCTNSLNLWIIVRTRSTTTASTTATPRLTTALLTVNNGAVFISPLRLASSPDSPSLPSSLSPLFSTSPPPPHPFFSFSFLFPSLLIPPSPPSIHPSIGPQSQTPATSLRSRVGAQDNGTVLRYIFSSPMDHHRRKNKEFGRVFLSS